MVGCDQRSQTPTQNNSGGTKLYQVVGDKVPVIITMPDGNMMRISQIGNWIFVAKTSSGYGEYGQKIGVGKGDAGRDYSIGNVYDEINYLEALAYFDNDWRKIYDPVLSQSQSVSNSVDPKFVRATFERLTKSGSEWSTPLVDDKPSEFVNAWWVQYDNEPPMTEKEMEELTQFKIPSDMLSGNYTHEKTAVYVRLDDYNLLRIGQLDITRNFDTKTTVTFHKTSNGYASSGHEFKILGWGGGYEHPVGNQYDEITAMEALSLIGNDPNRTMGIISSQSKVIHNTVEPDKVAEVFRSLGRAPRSFQRSSR